MGERWERFKPYLKYDFFVNVRIGWRCDQCNYHTPDVRPDKDNELEQMITSHRKLHSKFHVI